ncbi:MAG: hypothetical protein DRJ42_07155 [Deltaproteobacteria bacterium]|nr:MAG: hypothetical protein DRJ42_07155 [Deltaproteobacteria bacterium]
MMIALALGGCAAELKGPGLPGPDVAGKADFSDRVSIEGELVLAETVDGLVAEDGGEFTEDFEYQGFRLRTRGGSRLRVEVTQRGTVRGLDTVLYVYGPYGSGGYQSRLATDDDAGWGSLSRLDDLEFPETGDYLVVVGTHDGIGRGSYNLEATCLTGDCLDVEVPVTCPGSVEESIYECVNEWIAEGDYTDTRREGFTACTDAADDIHFETVCGASSSIEAWCLAGFDAYRDTVLPACVTALDPAFPEDTDPLGFRYRGGLGADIDARLEATESACCGASAVTAEVIAPTSGEAVTLAWVVDSVRQAEDMPSLWQTNAETDVAAFDRQAVSYDLAPGFVELLEANAGSNSFRIGHLDANWYAAAGAEAWEDLYIFYFDNGVVTTVRFSAGET